jgi:hypothetical protein
MASLDGRKPPTQRITNRGLCLTQATMTMIKHNPMNDPPQKTRKAFSQKQETPILGLQTFYPPIWLHPPKTRKAFSRKQETPILGHAAAEMDQNGAHGLIFAFLHFTSFAPCMVSRLCAGKSSAIYLVPRVFAQKGFAISIFGHFYLSIF